MKRSRAVRCFVLCALFGVACHTCFDDSTCAALSSFLWPPSFSRNSSCKCVYLLFTNERPSQLDFSNRSIDWWPVRVGFGSVKCVRIVQEDTLDRVAETFLSDTQKHGPRCAILWTLGRYRNRSPDLIAFVQNLRGNGNVARLGVMHCGDEIGLSPSWFYGLFDYVIRHFYYPAQFRLEGVYWMPLGTLEGSAVVAPRESAFGARIGAVSSRRVYFGNFLGNAMPYRMKVLVTERIKMLRNLQELAWLRVVDPSSPSVLHSSRRSNERALFLANATSRFRDGSSDAYRDALRQSIFTLAPEGTGKESFRVFEALEAGSIPVIKGGAEWTPLGPDHPLVVVRDWSVHALNDALRPYYDMIRKSNDSALNAYQLRVCSWWNRKKIGLRRTFRGLLLGMNEGTCDAPGNASLSCPPFDGRAQIASYVTGEEKPSE